MAVADSRRAAARVAAVASKYDNAEGDLTRAALRRLQRRQADAGKACARCGMKKPHAAFGRDERKADGLKSSCRLCLAAVERERRKRAS
jgi:hypothetical protein